MRRVNLVDARVSKSSSDRCPPELARPLIAKDYRPPARTPREAEAIEGGHMTMQAMRTPEPEVTSGTFEAEKPRDAIAEAHELACEIERLLTHRASDAEPYGRRLARALAQSLIDQLADLARAPKSTKPG
jgi:hypothetical protein